MQMLKKVNKDSTLVSTEKTEDCLVQIDHSKAMSDKTLQESWRAQNNDGVPAPKLPESPYNFHN